MNKYFAKVGVLALAAGSGIFAAGPASAAPPHHATPCKTHYTDVAMCFDFAAGQTPENVALEPDGDLDVSFSLADEIARVDVNTHRWRVLATLPQPADGGVNTPVLKRPVAMGIVRATDGTLYFLYAAGDKCLTGVWRLRPGGTPERIAPLPADSLPNGLALDPQDRELYIADSAPQGTIWAVPTTGGTPIEWLTAKAAPEIAAAGYLGVNGLKVHDGAVWASNTDKGTVLRIPILPGGAAGAVEVRASALPTIDDFAFTGPGDEILAAVNHDDTVVRIRPDGSHAVVLKDSDGLKNPTSLVVQGDSVDVLSAAYTMHTDPNIAAFPLHDLG